MFLLLAGLAGVTKPLSGQQYILLQYTTEDCLPDNTVQTLFKDSAGYLWLGLIDGGLIRYDGNEFEQIVCRDGVAGLPFFPHIKSIREDRKGHLWIESPAAHVACYDLASGRFLPLRNSAGEHAAFPDAFVILDDEVWLFGRRRGGAQRMLPEGKEIKPGKHYSKANGALPSDRITFIEKGVGSVVWIGTQQGLVRIARDGEAARVKDSGHFVRRCSYAGTDFHITADGSIYQFVQEQLLPRGVLPPEAGQVTGALEYRDNWIIFTQEGTYLFCFTDAVIKTAPPEYTLPGARTESDSAGNGFAYNERGKTLFVRAAHDGHIHLIDTGNREVLHLRKERPRFAVSPDGSLWIATHGQGLFLVRPSGETVRIDLESLCPDGQAAFLLDVTDDSEGTVWVASEFLGLFKITIAGMHASYIHLNHPDVTSPHANMVTMVRHIGGQAWVATGDGLLHRIRLPEMEKETAPGSYRSPVRCALETSAGDILIGAGEEGLKIGEARYRQRHDGPASFGENKVLDLLEDGAGRIWAALPDDGLGVGLRDGNGDYQFTRLFSDHDPNPGFHLLLSGRDGRIWAGSSRGLFVFHPDELLENPEAYLNIRAAGNGPLQSDDIGALYEDRSGTVWIAEHGYGFGRANVSPSGEIAFRHFSTRDGLINDNIHGITEDRSGKLWLSTSNGISCFDPQTESFSNHRFSSGMPGDKHNPGTLVNLPDGTVLSGTNNGLLVFRPEMAEEISSPGRLHITALKIGERTIRDGLDDIVLPYRDNSFDVCFTNLAFREETRYSWELEGYNGQRGPASRTGRAAFRNLPPGKYVLHLRSSAGNSFRIETLSVPLRIKAPFYRSAPACLLYALLFCTLLAFTRLTDRKITRLKARAEKERRIREVKIQLLEKDAELEFRRKMNAVMEERIGDPDFTVDAFAAAMAMGRSSFYAKVNRITGTSPNRLIRIYRLDKAAGLLLDKKYTIEQVSFMVGIKNPAYFSKLFKDEFGKTPKEYKSGTA